MLSETDAVIALISALPTAQRALDLVWEHLLPEFTDQPIPEAKTGLADKLASLALPTVTGELSSPTAARVAGIRFDFDDPAVAGETVEPGLLPIVPPTL